MASLGAELTKLLVKKDPTISHDQTIKDFIAVDKTFKKLVKNGLAKNRGNNLADALDRSKVNFSIKSNF